MAQREPDCRRRLFCSNEVLVEIFRYSSPWDLLELQATCWLFRQLLISKPSVWRDARSRLSPPVPDPVVPIDEDLGRFSRNWSEIAYATLIFGERECAFCQNVINDALPMGSYALRQFHCGKKDCIQNFERDHVRFSTFNSDSHGLSRIKAYLPYAEATSLVLEGTGHRLYSLVQLVRAAEEWEVCMLNLPERQEASSTSIFGFSMLLKHINIRIRWRNAIMGTAEALAAWRREYNAHPSTLRSNQRNWAILKLLAKLEGIKAFDFRVVFQRWLRAFSRSQTLINPSVWHHVRGDLLREVAEVAAAARAQLERENVPPANPNRVKCPHCPERKGRTFSVGDALSSHIKAKHSDLSVSVLGDSTNISVP